jgi:hypothetical protein
VIAFLGSTGKLTFVAEMKRRHIGRIYIRGLLNKAPLYPGERWAYDNGAYVDWQQGREFDSDAFLKDMDKITHKEHRPFFSVIPDLPADPGSLDFSMGWVDRVPTELTWYLAVQDGMDTQDVNTCIRSTPLIRGIFIGGSDEFKNRAPEFVDLAHNYGLPVHMGRASSSKRIRAAHEIGCDSFDTAAPLWEWSKFAKFLDCYDNYYETPQETFKWTEHS